jgi:hypothetical protein
VQALLCRSNSQIGISLLRGMTVVIYMANIAVKRCSAIATQGSGMLQRSYQNLHNVQSRQILKALATVIALVRFEVLTAVAMKSSIFWDISLCSPLNVNRRFGGTCRFHLQGNQHKAGSKQSLQTCSTCSSETSADFQRNTRRDIPVDRTRHSTWYGWLERGTSLHQL